MTRSSRTSRGAVLHTETSPRDGQDGASGSRSRAFSMFEAIAVLTIIALATAVVIGAFSDKGRPGSDEGARSALTSLVEAQTTEMMTNRAVASAAELTGRLTGIDVTGNESSDDTVVSLAVDGNVIGAAASTGAGSCWLVRRDFDGGSAPVVWSVASSGPCTGTRALTTTIVADRGETSDRPVLIS